MLDLLVHSSPDQVKIDVEVDELPGDQDAQVGGQNIFVPLVLVIYFYFAEYLFR